MIPEEQLPMLQRLLLVISDRGQLTRKKAGKTNVEVLLGHAPQIMRKMSLEASGHVCSGCIFAREETI
jgi:glycerol-3-phosphate responsive antiterminator